MPEEPFHVTVSVSGPDIGSCPVPAGSLASTGSGRSETRVCKDGDTLAQHQLSAWLISQRSLTGEELIRRYPVDRQLQGSTLKAIQEIA